MGIDINGDENCGNDDIKLTTKKITLKTTMTASGTTAKCVTDWPYCTPRPFLKWCLINNHFDYYLFWM